MDWMGHLNRDERKLLRIMCDDRYDNLVVV